jgi:type IV pilus assembly protein PilM
MKIRIPNQIFSKIFSKLRIKVTPKDCLGIDIGTSSIKIVALSKVGSRIKLDNYGETSALIFYEKPFRTFEKSTLLLSTDEIAKAVQAILSEAKITTKSAVFSIPDFSSFFTNFELPSMTPKELPDAVRYEAPQHIPLPISEVTIDWQVIGGRLADKKGTKLKILLVAVPNEIINQYKDIAQRAKVELLGLEAEVFGISRLVTNEEKNTIGLVDIGAQSTTISIIDGGLLKVSHSFDIAGNELTQILSKSLNVDFETAEEFKKRYGLLNSSENEGQKVGKILSPLIGSILDEINRAYQNFSQTEKKEVSKIVLAGGCALIPGLKEYFSSTLKKEVNIINPFADLSYPPVLDSALKEMGPSYAIAVGAALRGLG